MKFKVGQSVKNKLTGFTGKVLSVSDWDAKKAYSKSMYAFLKARGSVAARASQRVLVRIGATTEQGFDTAFTEI